MNYILFNDGRYVSNNFNILERYDSNVLRITTPTDSFDFHFQTPKEVFVAVTNFTDKGFLNLSNFKRPVGLN